MKSLIAWFVKNPVASNLMMVAMFVVGVFGYNNLQREFIPQVTVNGMTVSSAWPGASPRDVEEQIVVRIEEAIDGLDGVDGIQNLPPDAFKPLVFRWDAQVEILYLALYGDVDRLTLQRAANDLRLEISKLTGLQLTQQISKIDEQVTIEVSEDALREPLRQREGNFNCGRGLWLIPRQSSKKSSFVKRPMVALFVLEISLMSLMASTMMNLTQNLEGKMQLSSGFCHLKKRTGRKPENLSANMKKKLMKNYLLDCNLRSGLMVPKWLIVG